ncbi:potassium/proton antiporter [Nostocoides vanveenii]|uniref:Potassium/proton antiporter n=1 Tax=Nostocoides vanveenii TaxID=330835 RepID=A0ABN2KHF6_9MICO
MFPLATDLAAGFTLSELTIALLVGSLILIVCVAAIRLSTRTGMPSLLIYLAVGLAVGEKGLGIGFESEQLTQVLGYAALILILAEGGLSTQWSGIRGAVGPALILSTVGVVVSVAVVATAGHYVLGWSWVTALLIGAILSSTDAAAVFAVLRNVPLPRRLTGMLEAEAGFNDAPVVILVTALSAYAAHTGEVISPLWMPFVAIAELAGGALIGLLVGYLGGRLMRLSAAGASGLFSIGIIAVTVLAYAVAASLHLSGFIATYLAALVLGNMGLPHRAAVHAFATGVGWLAQIGLFVLLGLLASPSGFPTQVVPALVIGLVLLILARPLSVVASTILFGYSRADRLFLSWAGLRGAVPVVLATVPVTAKARNVDWIYDLVFVLVVIFTLVQAPTLPWVARILGVTESHKAREMTVESTPMDDLGAQLLHVDIGPASHLHGVAIFELRLPDGADVALVVRHGQTMVPTGRTTLRHDDQLLVVCTNAARERTEKLLHSISTAGRLAGWSARPAKDRKRPGRPGRGTVGSVGDKAE